MSIFRLDLWVQSSSFFSRPTLLLLQETLLSTRVHSSLKMRRHFPAAQEQQLSSFPLCFWSTTSIFVWFTAFSGCRYSPIFITEFIDAICKGDAVFRGHKSWKWWLRSLGSYVRQRTLYAAVQPFLIFRSRRPINKINNSITVVTQ